MWKVWGGNNSNMQRNIGQEQKKTAKKISGASRNKLFWKLHEIEVLAFGTDHMDLGMYKCIVNILTYEV